MTSLDDSAPAYTPDTVPPDTDRFIYRYVTRWRGEEVISELTQIAISQP
jgi:hypothetical protein